jgi:hypothetical protein
MSECIYSDEDLIAIETTLFCLAHGHKPERGERAQIHNRVRFNQNDDKIHCLSSLRSYFYQQHCRWPSTQEYDQLFFQLKERTT